MQDRALEILLVEDNEGDIVLTREALSQGRMNSNLHVARDGMEALELLQNSLKDDGQPFPDLILLDLNMPRMNGLELLDKIKKDDQLSIIPVIILTTSNAEQDVINSYKLNANCYIIKPVTFERFTEVVSSIETFWFSTVRLPDEA